MQEKELREAGLKVTSPRLKILEILENSDKKHLSAEGIYQILHADGSDIGLATVYRVLAQFEQASLITKHNFEGNISVYELKDQDHHDHMVCLETGKVIEFSNEEIEAIQKKVAEEHGYELSDHSLVLYVTPKK
jgi:Fur family ferric uptake transcriptional regulator